MRKLRRSHFQSDLEYNAYIEARKCFNSRSKKKLEYETTSIPYTIVSYRNYNPDFVVSFPCGHKRFIEMKGYFRPADRTKMLRVKKDNPKLDIRLVFPLDNKLSSKHKMRYSDWCKRYGFKYHIGPYIPRKWFNKNG